MIGCVAVQLYENGSGGASDIGGTIIFPKRWLRDPFAVGGLVEVWKRGQ